MPALSGFTDFNPDKDVGPLNGKVILITGGTAGLGRATATALARHNPAYIYFTGRRAEAGESLRAEIEKIDPAVGTTFLQMDMLSLASVKAACQKFSHDRLDILMCNAGIMAVPPALSNDGFETQFATNHLAHAMIIQQLLPVLLRTAERPGADVRAVCLTSLGWRAHPKGGVLYDEVRMTMDKFFGSWIRYGYALTSPSPLLYTSRCAYFTSDKVDDPLSDDIPLIGKANSPTSSTRPSWQDGIPRFWRSRYTQEWWRQTL